MDAIFPAKLLHTQREDVIDEEYFGFAFLYDNFSLVKKIGDDNGASFYLRSLSKPIQVSLAADFEIDLDDEQIAVASGSHCGTNIHIAVVKSILEDAGLIEDYLQCPPITPLDKRDFSGPPRAIHNNCSGKHALMLALCAHKGWNLETYLDVNHPLQKLIYQRHLELSDAKSAAISFDGCGAPVFALKINQIAKMFFNFFNNKKYDFIKYTMIKHPYILGGNNRLDTEIIELGQSKLVSKVGAGGFVAIYNLDCDRLLIVKMSQNNNPARRIITLNALKQLGWIDKNPAPNEIFSESNVSVGRLVCNFSFS